MNINYLFLLEQESNDLVHVEDVHHLDEYHASIPGNEFINMLLFCIDNCRWWTLTQILHNSTVKHVDANNTEQVESVQDNVEHANVPMAGKNTHS